MFAFDYISISKDFEFSNVLFFITGTYKTYFVRQQKMHAFFSKRNVQSKKSELEIELKFQLPILLTTAESYFHITFLHNSPFSKSLEVWTGISFISV